jgi:FKBP-type peptidyl-prolyl cis-trans isomerase 2
MIQNGSTVQVHYTGKFEDGQVFDSSVGRAPLQFQIGASQVIPGFENGLIGLNVGDKVTLNIPAVEAYGEVRLDLIVEVKNEQLPGKVELGQTLQTTTGGQTINLVVKEIYDNSVLLDANHPLAGKDLIFDIDVVEIG